MKIAVKKWHAVASWTWTTEDDVCGICHMALDGCAPGASGPGDDSAVVWGRVCDRAHMSTLSDFLRLHVLSDLKWFVFTVYTLFPHHVHQYLAPQQEHVPDLPTKVGICERAQTGSSDPRRYCAL